jgi:hypothetical protein
VERSRLLLYLQELAACCPDNIALGQGQGRRWR